MKYFFPCACLILLKIISFEFTYVFANDRILLFLSLDNIPLLHFFIHHIMRNIWLIPHLGCCKWCCNEYRRADICFGYRFYCTDFIFFRYTPQKHHMTILVLCFLGTPILFFIVDILIDISINVWRFPFFHMLINANLSCFC